MPQSLLLPKSSHHPALAVEDLVEDEPRWLDRHEVFDELLSRVVVSRFAESGYWHLRQIQVFAVNGRISLRGCLPTYYLKQVAQETAAATPGVSRVDNRVCVKKDT